MVLISSCSEEFSDITFQSCSVCTEQVLVQTVLKLADSCVRVRIFFYNLMMQCDEMCFILNIQACVVLFMQFETIFYDISITFDALKSMFISIGLTQDVVFLKAFKMKDLKHMLEVKYQYSVKKLQNTSNSTMNNFIYNYTLL